MGNPSKNNDEATRLVNLSTTTRPLGVIHVSGPDSAHFLNGQLSADVAKLSVGSATLAGLHSRDGRAIAVLRVLCVSTAEFYLVLPRERVQDVAARLAKFIFRAKTKLADASDTWHVMGHSEAPESVGTDTAPSATWSATRWISLAPANASPSAATAPAAALAWQRADIAEALPQVYAATNELFVSQMLNLDVLGGIAFDKGCYTGQEVIARAHYRGKVKRRMQRFATHESARIELGASITLTQGEQLKVVDKIDLPDGATEFLAVGAPPTAALDTSADVEATPAPGEMRVHATRLEMPYALPN
jgi:tRNA-modifying protein YgfZ